MLSEERLALITAALASPTRDALRGERALEFEGYLRELVEAYAELLAENARLRGEHGEPEPPVELLDCAHCGEDAILVSLPDFNFVRVRRASKCKRHRPGLCDICKTGVHRGTNGANGAKHEWNMRFAAPQETPCPD